MHHELSDRQRELLKALLAETREKGSTTITRLVERTTMSEPTARSSMQALMAHGYARQLWARGPFQACKTLDGEPIEVEVTLVPAEDAADAE